MDSINAGLERMTAPAETPAQPLLPPVLEEVLLATLQLREKEAARELTAHFSQFFSSAHLPPALHEVIRPFAELAERILMLPNNPSRTVALVKLLESKDAAVRAAVSK